MVYGRYLKVVPIAEMWGGKQDDEHPRFSVTLRMEDWHKVIESLETSDLTFGILDYLRNTIKDNEDYYEVKEDFNVECDLSELGEVVGVLDRLYIQSWSK